jgi:hypothetical protein
MQRKHQVTAEMTGNDLPAKWEWISLIHPLWVGYHTGRIENSLQARCEVQDALPDFWKETRLGQIGDRVRRGRVRGDKPVAVHLSLFLVTCFSCFVYV